MTERDLGFAFAGAGAIAAFHARAIAAVPGATLRAVLENDRLIKWEFADAQPRGRERSPRDLSFEPERSSSQADHSTQQRAGNRLPVDLVSYAITISQPRIIGQPPYST